MKMLLPFALMLGACATTTATAGLPQGTVRLGQTVRVGGPTVRPIAIVEDSRCPADVSCVWAGRLVVRVEVGTGRGKRRIDIEMGKPVHVADGMLTLRDVVPGKRQGQKLTPAAYRFSFDFAGSI